jgi:TonB family protein
LPKPPYPPAARAVRATGSVSVQVVIDTQGNVVSATAVSGHPLLRAAAEAAARGAKFSPTLLAGQPVSVSGIITYNFVL